MKRAWFALAILAALFCATLFHSRCVQGLGTRLTGLLTQAQAQAAAGNWQEAGSLTQAALELWEEQELYLHVALRHADTDQIQTCFGETAAFLDAQEQGEYAASNARLLSLISLLCEAEQLSLKNVL